MPELTIEEETDQLQTELVTAFLHRKVPFQAFNLLLTSALAMCEQPILEVSSVHRGREARALARLREAARLCR
jgi:hypothetical protein